MNAAVGRDEHSLQGEQSGASSDAELGSVVWHLAKYNSIAIEQRSAAEIVADLVALRQWSDRHVPGTADALASTRPFTSARPATPPPNERPRQNGL